MYNPEGWHSNQEIGPALVGPVASGTQSWQICGLLEKKPWYFLPDAMPLEETRWNAEHFDVKKLFWMCQEYFKAAH